MAQFHPEEGEPYWLMREPGKDHGFGTLPFSEARNAKLAKEKFHEQMDPTIRELFDLYGTEYDAVLVTFRRGEKGEPIVEEVS